MSFPQYESPERRHENLKNSIEVLTTLRRKANSAKNPLGEPRKKALLDLSRAAMFCLLRDKQSASYAIRDVFESDPSFRKDWEGLAQFLTQFQFRRLAYLIVRELGFPPLWLTNKEFRSALVRILAH